MEELVNGMQSIYINKVMDNHLAIRAPPKDIAYALCQDDLMAHIRGEIGLKEFEEWDRFKRRFGRRFHRDRRLDGEDQMSVRGGDYTQTVVKAIIYRLTQLSRKLFPHPVEIAGSTAEASEVATSGAPSPNNA